MQKVNCKYCKNDVIYNHKHQEREVFNMKVGDERIKVEIELTDKQKSEVATIYRRYYRGKWYQSDVPQVGYEKYYYATKVRLRLYYKDRKSAEKEAQKYNKRRAAYEKGKSNEAIPASLKWDDLPKNVREGWSHRSGSWLYEHANGDWEEDWNIKDMLEESDIEEDDDYGNSTKEFLEQLLMTPKYIKYELKKKDDGKWGIFLRP